MSEERGPLAGLKVLDLGQLLAGPFCATLLGYFGADVIKVEPPHGDPLRGWRVVEEGTSLWWRTLARNKESVVIDLREPAGAALVRALASKVDVLVENFRPGTMERWGLGPDVLRAASPRLVYVRVSGYGQTGPAASRPGFASVAEAVSGLRALTGHPDAPSVRANLSLGDSLAGLHGALGAVMALYARERRGVGQVVDVALTESVLNVLESTLTEAERGVVRQRSGTSITGIVPSNVYAASDGEVVIGANTDSLFEKLMRAIGRADLATDARLRTNPGRVAHQREIDDAIAAFARARRVNEVLAVVDGAGVPAGPVQGPAEVLADPQLHARGMLPLVRHPDGLRDLVVPELAPRLPEMPGRTRSLGPALGAHTGAALRRELGLDEAALSDLVAKQVIGGIV